MTAHEPRSDIRQARYCPKKKRCPKLSHLIILKKKEKRKRKKRRGPKAWLWFNLLYIIIEQPWFGTNKVSLESSHDFNLVKLRSHRISLEQKEFIKIPKWEFWDKKT